jgi:glutaredoxin-related protein
MKIVAFFAFLIMPVAAFLVPHSVSPSAGQQESRLFASTPNPIISAAAKTMSLLSPVFKVEAALQANLLGGSKKAEAQAEIAAAKKKNKVLIYSYALSPFSSEALALLDGSGYQYTKIELGAEWFLLGGKGSAIRSALGSEVESGATSLPKVFIGGNCIGGCAELSDLVASGELEGLMKKAKVPKSKQ